MIVTNYLQYVNIIEEKVTYLHPLLDTRVFFGALHYSREVETDFYPWFLISESFCAYDGEIK